MNTSILMLAMLPGADSSPDFVRDVQPFLVKHCYSCHDAKKAKAGFRIDQLGTDLLAGKTADVWKEVIDQINSGAMPPKSEPRPDAKQSFAVVEWVGRELKQAERNARIAGGRSLLRRLNRDEYANTVGDLLGLDPRFLDKVREELPADGQADGFDRVAAALFFDQTQLEKYLAVAELVAREAMQTAPPRSEKYSWQANRHLGEGVRQKVNENLDHIIETGPPTHFKTEKGMIIRSAIHYGGKGPEFIGVPPGPPPTLTNFIKQDGYYRIRFKGGTSVGDRGEPIRVKLVYVSGTPLEQTFEFKPNGTLEKPEVTELTVFLRAGLPDMTKAFHITWNGLWDARINHPGWQDINFRIMVGGAKIGQAVEKKDDDLLKKARADLDKALADAKAFTGTRWIHNEKYKIETLPKLLLDTIEVEGPVAKEWPPRSHAVLGVSDSLPQTPAGLRTVFERLLPRAYRRPVTPEEVNRVVGLAARAMTEKASFHEAIRIGLQLVLVSPGFVYLSEPEPKGTPRPLTDHELASRLSYFLWASMPDDELTRLAAAGKLRDPKVLDAQVARMLSDPKSRRFVESFAGQWLDVRLYGTVMPAQEYRTYDKALEVASKEEPLAFFEHLLRENLPISSFLDSNFLVINDRLAKHYGIDGVAGPEFRKVAIRPEHHRGGVLGMAGLMTLLSDGNRTLPVRRAAWVLEHLLNDPPPPPPPNAGDIQPNTAGKNLSVRQRLALHRNEPTCASCHAKLDPYGLSLENYDAIGAWREKQNGEGIRRAQAPKIDPSGELKSGRKFTTLEEYKAALVTEKDKFARAFAEKLLTYALCRPVGYVDRATVDELTATLAKNDHRIQPLIRAIVVSDVFRNK
jgi:hypothetical protein